MLHLGFLDFFGIGNRIGAMVFNDVLRLDYPNNYHNKIGLAFGRANLMRFLGISS